MSEQIGGQVPEGWEIRTSAAFGSLVGPFWIKREPAGTACGFLADNRHGNRRGVVHGGMLATLADTALGIVVSEQVGGLAIATVQLNIHYADAVRPGEFVAARSEVVRVTRALVFMRARLAVDARTVVMADGIWKVLRPRHA